MQPRSLARATGAVTVAGVAGVGYAWAEARWFTVRRYTVPALPPGSPSLRVLHLSDLHVVPRQQRKLGWLASLCDLEPDLVVSTGDNIAAQDAVPHVLRAHGALLDVPGAFVLGSNDYWAPKFKSPLRYFQRDGGRRRIHGQRLPTDDLVEGFTKRGWVDLNDRRARLQVGGVDLDLVGVDDPHLRYDHYPEPAPVPAGAVRLGVVHAPYRRVLDAMVDDGAAAILAGHTHGGQLCLPGVGTLVTNCDLPRQQARGVSRWDHAWLHVCAGAGTSPYTPVRFACRPEAALVTLVARPENDGSRPGVSVS